MIGCCEIAITLALTNLFSLAIFAGYTVKMKEKQLLLEREVKEVERVNGKEKAEIRELQIKTQKLEEALKNYGRK